MQRSPTSREYRTSREPIGLATVAVQFGWIHTDFDTGPGWYHPTQSLELGFNRGKVMLEEEVGGSWNVNVFVFVGLTEVGGQIQRNLEVEYMTILLTTVYTSLLCLR